MNIVEIKNIKRSRMGN